jgi:hypothetical protein
MKNSNLALCPCLFIARGTRLRASDVNGSGIHFILYPILDLDLTTTDFDLKATSFAASFRVLNEDLSVSGQGLLDVGHNPDVFHSICRIDVITTAWIAWHKPFLHFLTRFTPICKARNAFSNGM